jgi:AhpD family alkylhydroperoxidase
MNRTKQLDDYMDGLAALGKEAPDAFQAFGAAYGTVFADGALSAKNKHLIAIALSVQSRCKHAVTRHVSEALKAGAQRREIVEAAMVAAALSGGAALACAATALREALDEFGAL